MCRPSRCMNCTRNMYPEGRRNLHRARGLCHRCYQALFESGELIAFERITRTRDEVMEDWEILRSHGCTKRQAAERIGMSFAAFSRAYDRARAAGDNRAVAR